jgi:hypothetical protein
MPRKYEELRRLDKMMRSFSISVNRHDWIAHLQRIKAAIEEVLWLEGEEG